MILFMENWEGSPLQVNTFYAIIKYWFKILESDNTKCIRYAYELMLSDLHRKPNTVNWAYKVILSSLGFYEVWLTQGVGNKNMLLSELKLRLNDNCIQYWDSRLTDSSRAKFYCLFSDFLNWLNDMPIVSLTCQYRSCISKLISEWNYMILYQFNHNLIITY